MNHFPQIAVGCSVLVQRSHILLAMRMTRALLTDKREYLDSVREQVYQCCDQQGGVFRPGQLIDWEVNPAVVRTMVRTGRWRRIRYGVYTDTNTIETARDQPDLIHELNLAAAIVSLREPAAAIGKSAALLHGLPLPKDEPTELEIIRDCHADLRALHDRVQDPLRVPRVKARTLDFSKLTIETVRGIPTVDKAWAAVTAACRLPRNYQVAMLDSALWQGQFSYEHLESLCESGGSLRGMQDVRRALPLATDGAQTVLETISRLTFSDYKLPIPTLQEPIRDARGLIGVVDFAWLALGVLGEADGAIKYTDSQTLMDERAREQRLRDAGYEVFRWTWSEIHNEPVKVVNRFHAAVRKAKRVA